MSPFQSISISKHFWSLCIVAANLIPCYSNDILNSEDAIKGDRSTLKKSETPIIIYPKVRYKRSLSDSGDKSSNHDLQIQFNHESEEFAIYLRKNDHLVTTGALVEWNYPNGTRQLSKLDDIGKGTKVDSNDKNDNYINDKYHKPDDCLFIGEVISGTEGSRDTKDPKNSKLKKSVAAIDVCDGGYRGYLQIGKDGYIIRPLKDHEIYLSPRNRRKDGHITSNVPHDKEHGSRNSTGSSYFEHNDR